MSTLNPYQSPTAELLHRPADGTCLRDGDGVIVPHGADLPARCIHCNAPAEMPVKRRTLYWHSPWLYLVILIGVLIYAVIALIVRKRVQLSPALCRAHSRARRRDLWIGTVALVGGLIGMFAALSSDEGGVAGLLGLLAFASMVYLVLRSRLLRATRIDDRNARVVGFGKPFLASLGR